MRASLYSLLFISLILSSCLLSVNPLITYKNIERFPSALGSWTDNEGTRFTIEMFFGSSTEMEGLTAKNNKVQSKEKRLAGMAPEERKTMQAAQLVSYTSNNLKHEMILSFSRINNDWFAQLTPLRVYKPGNQFYDKQNGIVRDTSTKDYPMEKSGYSFYRVESTTNELKFIPVNDDFLLDLITKGWAAIPYEKDELFETSLITASPEILVKFFEKYGNDSRLFDKSSTLVLKRNLK